MVLKNIVLEVGIPEGVEVNIQGSLLNIKGKNGGIERDFYHPKISIQKLNNNIKIEGKKLNSRERIVVPTFRSLISNSIKGVTNPYVYKLKICSGHFPIKVGMENGKFVIRNLFGEKVPRIVNIPKNVKVNISSNEVSIESVDKEAAGQTAVKIERSAIRPGFDKRVFQDGIYIIKKADEE